MDKFYGDGHLYGASHLAYMELLSKWTYCLLSAVMLIKKIMATRNFGSLTTLIFELRQTLH